MTEEPTRCLSSSFTALMSRVLDNPVQLKPETDLNLASLINALKSNDQRLKAIIESNEQTKQRFLQMGKELKEIHTQLANRDISCSAKEADLGLLMTSHFPRTLAKGKRFTVSCKLINKQGQPMSLFHATDCYLDMQNVTEGSADIPSRYSHNSDVRTWHSILTPSGEVTFLDVHIPDIVRNAQHNKFTLTVSCPNEGRINALVLDGLSIKTELRNGGRGRKHAAMRKHYR